MAALGSNAANAAVSLSQKLKEMTASGSRDYNSWRKLVLDIETATPEDIDTISLAYDSLLSIFPLCHWHLEKYAYHKAKLCGTQEAVKIYEQGVGVAKFSVGFWVDYFTFGAACFGDPEDVRRLFGRALSFVGKDYCCHVLWDKYMKYEFCQEGWRFLAQSYIQTLRFPTKKLHFYYNNFKQFVANSEEEIGYEKDNSIEVEQVTVPCAVMEISKEEISLIIKDLLESSDRSTKSKALDRYRSIGEELYREASHMDEKVKCFEAKIQKRYFNVTPLDDDQLNNWHLYLDFTEKQDNLDWAVNLYERCLIPCAKYPEFWMRYVEFLESKGGRELAISALDRATQIFVKNVPEIHLFNARFKEHIGDTDGARAAFLLCETKTESGFIEKVVAQANLERRLGNFSAASATYEKALKTATDKQKLHILPSLYSQFARLTLATTGSAADARDILIEGVRCVPHCRLLLEELIKFAMTHDGASHITIIDAVVADVISPGLHEYEGFNAKDRENMSWLFVEFVNLCGTMHDIRKAWNRHVKLFPESLRVKPAYKRSSTANDLLDVARDQNGKDAPALQDLPRGQEQVLEFPANDEIHRYQFVGKLSSPQKDCKNNARETVAKAVVLSNENASWDDENVCQSREGKPQSTESDQDLSCQCREEKPGQMDVDDESAKQSEENVVGPHESVLEVGKSSGTFDSVSLSNVSLNSQKKGSCELVPMSCDEYETESGPKVSPNSKAGPSVESPQVHHDDSEKDGSVFRQHDTPTEIHAGPEEPSSTGEDSTDIDHMVHGDAQQGSGMRKRSQAQLGDVEEGKATDGDRPTSSHPVSYPQQNTNQMTSLSPSPYTWQTQQGVAMNQMLQYNYHQQQLLQQQYQQQMYMQHPYFQMQQHYMSQQPYQLQPQQYNQQQFVQQQQPMPLFQQSQQHHQQNPQILGQQAHEKQHQPQDLAYQSYQLACQQASQGQQLFSQQYQQYQGYQQSSQEGYLQTQGLHAQEVVSKQNLAQNMSQSQQGSNTAPPDHNASAEPSDSPNHRVQSPLQ